VACGSKPAGTFFHLIAAGKSLPERFFTSLPWAKACRNVFSLHCRRQKHDGTVFRFIVAGKSLPEQFFVSLSRAKACRSNSSPHCHRQKHDGTVFHGLSDRHSLPEQTFNVCLTNTSPPDTFLTFVCRTRAAGAIF